MDELEKLIREHGAGKNGRKPKNLIQRAIYEAIAELAQDKRSWVLKRAEQLLKKWEKEGSNEEA